MTPAEDLVAIHRLRARYCQYLDGKDWDAFRDLFDPGCVFRYSRWPDQEVVGPDRFIERCGEGVDGAVTQHVALQPEIEIESAGTASGVWVMHDEIESVGAHERRRLVGSGHYHERYIRHPDRGWRIASWELRRTRLEVTTTSWFVENSPLLIREDGI